MAARHVPHATYDARPVMNWQGVTSTCSRSKTLCHSTSRDDRSADFESALRAYSSLSVRSSCEIDSLCLTLQYSVRFIFISALHDSRSLGVEMIYSHLVTNDPDYSHWFPNASATLWRSLLFITNQSLERDMKILTSVWPALSSLNQAVRFANLGPSAYLDY